MTRLERLYKKADALPLEPGVYIMKNESDEIIYIGKAKVLRNRVSQYFASQNKHTLKVRKMVENVNDFDYIIVGSEFEALVLECSLIKQNKPKYNILLKDDKGYSYVKIDGDKWKKIQFVHQKADDGAKYFGPFTSADYVGNAVNEALDIFMLPHCGKTFPRDINRHSRPCLNFHIGKCRGACSGKITAEENNKAVNDAVSFIFGNRGDIISGLKKEMEKASDELDFEAAAVLRDRIKAIEKTSQKQHVVSVRFANQDVFGLETVNTKSCLNVLRFRDSNLISTETFILGKIEDPAEEYAEILTGYYNDKNDFPERICTDTAVNQQNILEEYFSSKAGRKVLLYTPLAGESVTLIDMAKHNAREKLTRILSYNDKRESVLHDLQDLLGLPKLPEYIESYDISNLNGENNVCGMIVYQNGQPNRRNYRYFQIKSFEGQDDFRSLAEVLNRRIGEYEIHKEEHCGYGIKPDLILLDGGAGQVNAVKEIFEKRGFDVPLFGMVKDGKHRTRAISSGGEEITINDNRSLFAFIGEIQEEVHRFAIGYHRKLRKKNTLETELTKIDGIGEKRAKEIMIRFRSLKAVSEAELDEILMVPGMTQPAAEAVYKYFRNKSN